MIVELFGICPCLQVGATVASTKQLLALSSSLGRPCKTLPGGVLGAGRKGTRECQSYFLGQVVEDWLHDGEASADNAKVGFKDGEDERYPSVVREVGFLEMDV